VAIDIETGAYEIDGDELAAPDRLLARVPDAQSGYDGLVSVMRTASDDLDWAQCFGKGRLVGYRPKLYR
jgi:hypothetical protein